MFDGGMALTFHKLNYSSVLAGNLQKNRTHYRARSNPPVDVHFLSVLVQIDESKNSPQSKKISGSGTAPKRYQNPNSLLKQANTVGIIGGVSVLSTLIFLEKLVWWSSRDGEECIPFVVCSDPSIARVLPSQSFTSRNARIESNVGVFIENLQRKRKFLEQSGARCLVMPCHVSHAWYDKISEDCLLPFFHVGDCVASELKEAKLKPLEAGSNVRIGMLASNSILTAGFYQEKLQNQGFEVVLPDRATMDHILIPAVEALSRRDMEGARNLLRIAIQILLVRAVNVVILASDELQGLLPHDEPLLKKCIDPMDALARSAIRWARH
ncbi:hypothetical protein P3X46_031541 [Hevea brasiliensis]|uniref:Aspartate racemase n=1 Tax=Hevea brasiliensis TaxID=3981 RepID=A0ABQ9KM01_HEVBR|nr:uncharacterized protein LOC110655676 isoform X2 [Hevea brasiliensis]KAJ9140952.1 hypothetical protein P3X46_031541 [Hevea brasiliensis]